MTRAFIWDLDGTLLDSYDAILAGIEETYMHYGLDFDRPAIHAYILQHSVQKLLEKVAIEKGLDAEEMNRFRGQSLQEKMLTFSSWMVLRLFLLGRRKQIFSSLSILIKGKMLTKFWRI